MSTCNLPNLVLNFENLNEYKMTSHFELRNIHTYTKTTPDIKNIHASDINKHPHSMLESTKGWSFMLLTKHQYQHNVFMEKCKAFMQVNKLTTISMTYQEHTA